MICSLLNRAVSSLPSFPRVTNLPPGYLHGERPDGIDSTVRELSIGREAPRFFGHIACRVLLMAERVTHLGIDRTGSCRSWWHKGAEIFLNSD
jgi:hypothetical protein